MGTRWFLALLSLFFMLLAPVTSFPTRSTEQSHKNLAGVTSFLRMLKDHIVNRSRGTGSRGPLRGPKGYHQVTPNVNSHNSEVLPAWPPKSKAEDWVLDLAPKDDLSNLANDSERDFSPDMAAAVGSTELEDDKRDYGHGMFFGKRVPNDKYIDRQLEDPTMQRQRRPDDYNWGMWFGKRDKADLYGWGGFFGKRSGDDTEYEDFVA